MIYFDHAAGSFPKPPEVETAVLHALRTAGNAGRGAHGPTLTASKILYEARTGLAELFHAEDPSRIAFTCNATEALNLALQGLLRPGDHVITTACEHNSVLRPLYLMERRGVELTILPCDRNGGFPYDVLPLYLRPGTRAVVTAHAGNLTGNVTDLRRISAFAKAHRLLLIVDAAQTAGIFPIDVQGSGIDVLCFTGHKGLLGPQGTGGLYLREGLSPEPLKVGGTGTHSFDPRHPSDMPDCLEAGTMNAHGIAGLNAGVRLRLQEGVEAVREKEAGLTRQFLTGIQDLPNLHLYGDFSGACPRVPIVSLNLGNEDSAVVSDWLWEHYGICVRSGAHCAPLMHQAFGTAARGAVRFSFGSSNRSEEIQVGIDAIRRLAALIS